MKISFRTLTLSIFFGFIALILVLVQRGIWGNPNAKDLNSRTWKQDGVFELSPERGRFSLLYSLMEDKSFSYSVDIARFATPDLGLINGKYVSLFAPALSFIVAPGYLIGKYFNASQIGAFTVISIFALLNSWLIYLISFKFTKNKYASMLGSLVFLFATPGFAYSVNLYQHHVSTFILLLAVYLLFFVEGWVSTFVIFFLCAVSIPLDYPNLFLMLPVGLYTLPRFIELSSNNFRVKGSFKLLQVLAVVGVIPALIFFTWFNKNSYGNPLQFSGTVASVKALDENGNPAVPDNQKIENVSEFVDTSKQKKDAVSFFDTRDVLNGVYIHLISPDRGVVFYTPVMLLGIFGLFLLNKNEPKKTVVLIFVSGITFLLYSMWGDPWGGWAFGSRYLIPVYSLLSIGIAELASVYRKKLLFTLLFLPIFGYSVYVNTAGALGTLANPPQVEVLFLESQTKTIQKYTYDRSVDYIKAGKTKSIVYNSVFKDSISLYSYFLSITTLISLVGLSLVIIPYILEKKYAKN